jgi:hypothetical protein
VEARSKRSGEDCAAVEVARQTVVSRTLDARVRLIMPRDRQRVFLSSSPGVSLHVLVAAADIVAEGFWN